MHEKVLSVLNHKGCAEQNYTDSHQQREINTADDDEKKKTLLHCWWVCMQTCQSNMEVSVETVLKKPKLEFLYDPVTPVLGVHLKPSKSPYNRD